MLNKAFINLLISLLGYLQEINQRWAISQSTISVWLYNLITLKKKPKIISDTTTNTVFRCGRHSGATFRTQNSHQIRLSGATFRTQNSNKHMKIFADFFNFGCDFSHPKVRQNFWVRLSRTQCFIKTLRCDLVAPIVLKHLSGQLSPSFLWNTIRCDFSHPKVLLGATFRTQKYYWVRLFAPNVLNFIAVKFSPSFFLNTIRCDFVAPKGNDTDHWVRKVAPKF